jgi:hypothetical protein
MRVALGRSSIDGIFAVMSAASIAPPVLVSLGTFPRQRALNRARLPHCLGRTYGAPGRKPYPALARQRQRADHLFDKGFIASEGTERLIVSPVADPPSLKRMGIDRDAPVNVGTFSEGQRHYLEYHRENVLRMARGINRVERKG